MAGSFASGVMAGDGILESHKEAAMYHPIPPQVYVALGFWAVLML
jgi:hypothetical protein